jgi:hypothetical protein
MGSERVDGGKSAITMPLLGDASRLSFIEK